MKIAVQMYTLRNEAEQDYTGTLKRVAEIGYDGVELAGYGGLTADELKKELDFLGLQAAASHIPLDRLKNDIQSVIEEQKTLNCHHIVCPFIQEDVRDKKGYEELVNILNKAGEEAGRSGITLSYHNHDFELHPLPDGTVPLEYLFDNTNPDWVQAEFDVYWLKKGGSDPLGWLDKYQSRMKLIHLKDMTTDGEKFFAELGTGGLNIEEICKKTESIPLDWWIVEQDQSRKTPFESIEESLRYLNRRNTNA
ncbi:sugar phosphate isomerase/epimerase family protein [Jeotgalibacillus terrae]|uniref:Sugar phosphate isomerase/epimerase family protein n=1 Tax=Jeotgalibacillus terrae TaxID=587735 RepID=A0ABW5ZJM1_9BACL|nr:sugar phosphate isomerase/epimerase [Jeotgalibacillus terrae]MBM7579636.1 sugar phosphate isomerase/epimerase [Jeotgalibacillus terrae]